MDIVELPTATGEALLRQLQSLGETRRLEFKRVSGKMVSKALETICALANADGGLLVLGLADLKDFEGT
jgi:ATP-dependent DNA helicase RecG